ncbi:hypothetical protein [Roseateles microcysteis]|uniref:hypothetical protein n=1 Tax=Roseateles microcysteis TaxID=3119057 RepID=UPI002FE6486B
MNREEPSSASAAPEHSSRAVIAASIAPINRSRRRLVSGVAGGTGVLLASASKTALGTGTTTGTCKSPSAVMSGNMSPRPGGSGSCSGGRSPGFWKVPQKFNYWTGVSYPTFYKAVDVCSAGMQGLALTDIKTQGTLANAILPGAGYIGSTAYGVWAVLAFPTSFPGGQLQRHLLAAYLNASYWPSEYPITKAQILSMWNATKSGGTWCAAGVTCSKPWTATDVINYISGMYDINADVGADPDLCTK